MTESIQAAYDLILKLLSNIISKEEDECTLKLQTWDSCSISLHQRTFPYYSNEVVVKWVSNWSHEEPKLPHDLPVYTQPSSGDEDSQPLQPESNPSLQSAHLELRRWSLPLFTLGFFQYLAYQEPRFQVSPFFGVFVIDPRIRLECPQESHLRRELQREDYEDYNCEQASALMELYIDNHKARHLQLK